MLSGCQTGFILLQAYEAKLEDDLKNLKDIGLAQSAQIDGLKMVPTLFGVINFS